jgi:hypothetical protein
MADQTAYRFACRGENTTTKKKANFSKDFDTLDLKTGMNELKFAVEGKHSGENGPDVDMPLLGKGFLWYSVLAITCMVEAEPNGDIKIYPPSRPKKLKEDLLGDSKMEISTDKGADYLSISVVLKVDAIWQSTGTANFVCKLSAEKPKPPAPPKITKKTVVVGSFVFGESAINKIKPISDWFDYAKLHAWYDKLPERTRSKIEEEQKPPGGKMIIMKGFTDNVGDEHQNLELGKRRAIAVAEAFEKISGVSWRKIITAPSKGEQDNPQENKKLEKKEPKHRRVEVTIYIEE